MGPTKAWNPVIVTLLAAVSLGLLIYAGVSCSFLNVVAHNGDLLVVLPTSQQTARSVATIGLLCAGNYYDLKNDKMWNLSRMFFFVSALMGAISTLLALIISTCLSPSSALWITLSVLAAITAVVQVPVFLLFQSEPCSDYHADQSCHLGLASFVMIGSVGGWVCVVLLTQILDPPVWVRELDHWRVQKINATGQQSEDGEGLLRLGHQVSSSVTPVHHAAAVAGSEAAAASPPPSSTSLLSRCSNWNRRRKDQQHHDDMTPTLALYDEEEGGGANSSEDSIYMDRTMEGLVGEAGFKVTSVGEGLVTKESLDECSLDEYGFRTFSKAAQQRLANNSQVMHILSHTLRDRSMDTSARGSDAPPSYSMSLQSSLSRDVVPLKIIRAMDIHAPTTTEKEDPIEAKSSREQTPITHAVAHIMPVVSAISGDTDGIDLNPESTVFDHREYQVIPVEDYQREQLLKADLNETRSVTLGSLVSKSTPNVTGDESILDGSREPNSARSRQEEQTNATQSNRSTGTPRGRSSVLSGVRGLAEKLRSASLKARLRKNYSLMDDDNMDTSFPLSPPVEIITLNGGDEELCNLSPALVRSESELNLLNHWNRMHGLPRGIAPVVLNLGPEFSFSDDETGDDRTPDPIAYHDGDALMTYGSLAGSSPRSEMAKSHLRIMSPDPLCSQAFDNRISADGSGDASREYNSHQVGDDFNPYTSTHPFKRTRSAPNLASFSGACKTGPKLSEDINMSGMHQYHRVETWRTPYEHETDTGREQRGRRNHIIASVPKRKASPIFRRDRDARGATFHIVSDDSKDDEDAQESSLESLHTSRSRLARQARMQRMRRGDTKPAVRSRTVEPPANRRSGPIDPYSSSSLLNTLDLQLAYVQRPEGQEYGPEEGSL